jgi:hypothetical protein
MARAYRDCVVFPAKKQFVFKSTDLSDNTCYLIYKKVSKREEKERGYYLFCLSRFYLFCLSRVYLFYLSKFYLFM